MDNNVENQKQWHVVYTRSRAEKKVYDLLKTQHIECFLPLQKKLRKWKDRKKWVEVPIISGYCFVHIDQKQYESVLKTNHVVSYVRFEGKPARVPQSQIDLLKRLTAQSEFEIDVSHETFEPGKKAEIISGPLMGLRGELLSCRGKDRFIIRIEQINTVFSVELPAEKLTLLPQGDFIPDK
jgi:transcription antitermination factor NusG